MLTLFKIWEKNQNDDEFPSITVMGSETREGAVTLCFDDGTFSSEVGLFDLIELIGSAAKLHLNWANTLRDSRRRQLRTLLLDMADQLAPRNKE